MRRSIISVAALACAASAGLATQALAADDDSFTIHGITLYGTLDIGVAYQTHGTPLSSDFYPGLEYMISKNSNNAITGLAPNGLSQSKLGFKGIESITDDLSGIFKLEASFEPQSGNIGNSSQSLVANNGVALANQTSGADGSREGQLFAQQAWFGLTSKRWGTVTLGRNTTVLNDDITAYDPQGGSFAFSPIGYSGSLASGAGDTEDTRMNNTIKYSLDTIGPVRAAALYQFSSVGNKAPGAYQFDLGADYMGLSIDGIYAHTKDAISLASYASGAFITLNGTNTTTPGTAYTPGTLTATVSDNTAFGVFGKYTYGPAKLFAGFEHIEYRNPSNPLGVGVEDDGGYIMSSVTNVAYNNAKVLTDYWFGIKYAFMPELDLTGAFYRINQNSYNGDNGCSAAAISAKCSGYLQALSLVLDYRITKRWDFYGGAMYSMVAGGYANGYLYTHTVDPMVGARFNF